MELFVSFLEVFEAFWGKTLIHNHQDQKHWVGFLLSCTAALQIASHCPRLSPLCAALEASGFNLKTLQDGRPGVCLPASFPWFALLQNATFLPPLHVSCKPVAPATLLLPLCTQSFSPERGRTQRVLPLLLGCYAHLIAATASKHSVNNTRIFGPLNPEVWQLCHHWCHLKPPSTACLSPAW